MGNRLRCFAIAASVLLAVGNTGRSAGVTIITHGLSGSIDDWVISMADQITRYPLFPTPDFACYEIYFQSVGNQWIPSWRRLAGSVPSATTSGEIIVKLDWSQLANDSYSTFQIAAAVVPRLLDPNFISEMNGHALAELPLHLIGHSRGGSLVCEMSRLLGREGVWVDHLTTLDPHPLNNDGFSDFPYTAVDAPARTYENVLFHDNYFQVLNVLAPGEPIAGAYVRQLISLEGGYGGLVGSHSDVHLWYHGTIDVRTTASDTVAFLTPTERGSWYTAAENIGVNAGYIYSRVGQGDRTSSSRPAGSGGSMIRDGYNQYWDLGAGLANNRVLLDVNSGNWPNLILANTTGSNIVQFGGFVATKIYWQWEKPSGNTGQLEFYLDDDWNPLNANSRLLRSEPIGATGTLNVGIKNVSLPIDSQNSTPGYHVVYAKITAGSRSRYLYARQVVDIFPSFAPPSLAVGKSQSAADVIVTGQAGQAVVIEASDDLKSWIAVSTNRLSSSQWSISDSLGSPKKFYRAKLRL